MRASDIVKGKTKSIYDLNGVGDNNRPVLQEEKTTSGSEESLRLSDIDILSMKGTAGRSLTAATKRHDADAFTQGNVKDKSVPEGQEKISSVNILPPPGSDRFEDKDQDAACPSPQGATLKRIYLAAKEYMVMVRQSVQEGKRFNLEQALIYVNNIINSSEDVVSQIYQLTVDYEQEDEYYISSPVNVMVYGLKVAQGLGYDKKELIEIGLAALLHDVGMFTIPEKILNKEGKLTEEEMEMIRKHPEKAVEILMAYRDAYPKMIRAIYEHQERVNGQGYPQGLKGDEICDFAQIIGICDSYEAMTHHRPHKKPLLQTESIKELIGSRSNLFDLRIIKAFLEEISIYPVGCYVRLNNRNLGRVVATNKGYPMKPVLKLISDEKGKPIEPPRIIDLRNYPILNIERGVSPEEISA
ncbi:MAG: HD-GYP domain-containing protein [Syntrophobacterales bacterium]|nr:HD-GYP domain-containing protein [Syntrophobacterales bacterium]